MFVSGDRLEEPSLLKTLFELMAIIWAFLWLLVFPGAIIYFWSTRYVYPWFKEAINAYAETLAQAIALQYIFGFIILPFPFALYLFLVSREPIANIIACIGNFLWDPPFLKDVGQNKK